VKTFFVRKRVRGRDSRIIIGKYPGIDIQTARDRIDGILATATVPRKVRRKKITFADFTAQFVHAKIRRAPKSMDKLRRTCTRLWAPIANTTIEKISANDITVLHDQIAENSGIATANRMLEIMSGIFKYAIDQGYRTKNPAVDIPKFKEQRAPRILTAAGLRRIHTAAKSEKNPVFRSAFLMLVYGFDTKSKIFSMRWPDLDLNSNTWKNEPLSDMAVELLRELNETSKWVFPHWGRHLVDPRNAWKQLAERAKTPGVSMSDVNKFINRQLEWTQDKYELRRNMNSVLSSLL
jgi:site-specific recombinase XerD